MKKQLFTFLIGIISLNTFAQWTATNNGGASDLITHNGKLFAVTAAQALIMSSDNGDTWTDITTDTLSGRLDFLTSAGNRLYAATYNNFTAAGLVYFSTDEGTSWALDTAGMPPLVFGGGKADVRLLMTHNGDQLVANFGGADAYCTKNVSDPSWTVMSDLAAVDPDNYLSRNDTLIAIAGNDMRYSTDNGQTFTTVSTTGLPSLNRISDTWWDGNRIYLGVNLFTAEKTSLYYSDDFGSNWDSLAISQYVGTDFTSSRQVITAIYAQGSDIYFALYNDRANTTADIFYSNNGGQSFAKDTAGLTVDNFSTEQVLKFHKNNGRLFTVHSNTDIHYKDVGNSMNLREKNASSIGLFPNPARNHVHVSTKLISAYLVDVTGKKHTVLIQNEVVSFDVPTGLYLLLGETSEGETVKQKLMVN